MKDRTLNSFLEFFKYDKINTYKVYLQIKRSARIDRAMCQTRFIMTHRSVCLFYQLSGIP